MAAPFEDWYKSMPIVTKTYMTASVLTTLAVYLDVVSALDLYLNFPLIIHKYQFWRIITNFLFFGQFGINFLFHMYFLVRHSRRLEESFYRERTADYLFMWIFGSTLLIIIDAIFLYTGFLTTVMFMAPSLAFMVVYVWSRRNPHVRMSFLGLFTFNAPYLPWVILGFGLLLNQNPIFDVLGIAVGHIYYWLEDVYPPLSGRRLLRTPGFLKYLLDNPEHPRVVPAPQQPVN